MKISCAKFFTAAVAAFVFVGSVSAGEYLIKVVEKTNCHTTAQTTSYTMAGLVVGAGAASKNKTIINSGSAMIGAAAAGVSPAGTIVAGFMDVPSTYACEKVAETGIGESAENNAPETAKKPWAKFIYHAAGGALIGKVFDAGIDFLSAKS